jgi:hypothetical protein
MSPQEQAQLQVHSRYRVGLIAGIFFLLAVMLAMSVLSALQAERPQARPAGNRESAAGQRAVDAAARHGSAHLLDWHLLMGATRRDDAARPAGYVQGVVVVMGQIAEPDAYALYRIDRQGAIPWLAASDSLHTGDLSPLFHWSRPAP